MARKLKEDWSFHWIARRLKRDRELTGWQTSLDGHMLKGDWSFHWKTWMLKGNWGFHWMARKPRGDG